MKNTNKNTNKKFNSSFSQEDMEYLKKNNISLSDVIPDYDKYFQKTHENMDPNAEVEGDELIQDRNGLSYFVKGDSHKKGGIDIHVNEGSFVLSNNDYTKNNNLKLPKELVKLLSEDKFDKQMSPAKLAKKLKLSTAEDFKKLETKDIHDEITSALNIQKKNSKIEDIKIAQEMLKYKQGMNNNLKDLLQLPETDQQMQSENQMMQDGGQKYSVWQGDKNSGVNNKANYTIQDLEKVAEILGVSPKDNLGLQNSIAMYLDKFNSLDILNPNSTPNNNGMFDGIFGADWNMAINQIKNGMVSPKLQPINPTQISNPQSNTPLQNIDLRSTKNIDFQQQTTSPEDIQVPNKTGFEINSKEYYNQQRNNLSTQALMSMFGNMNTKKSYPYYFEETPTLNYSKPLDIPAITNRNVANTISSQVNSLQNSSLPDYAKQALINNVISKINQSTNTQDVTDYYDRFNREQLNLKNKEIQNLYANKIRNQQNYIQQVDKFNKNQTLAKNNMTSVVDQYLKGINNIKTEEFVLPFQLWRSGMQIDPTDKGYTAQYDRTANEIARLQIIAAYMDRGLSEAEAIKKVDDRLNNKK